ncbi:amidohydrolase [Pseudokineococcus sp. 1T1Z-3]|uniref:amidohydrolase n=1 Tax=Pseudokineococcus sp. 1T1Z-3 TaxID=3132745 RepID=UPI0030A393E6
MTGTPLVDDALRADLHDLYRTLHAAPELSMAEHATARLLTERVEALGLTARTVGGTGVVAVLENGPGPVVAFRADTDGLPVAEDSGVDYASTARGVLPDGSDVPVMHACGHDTHMTSAIGLAALLARDRSAWAGTFVLLLQPGEETGAGARAMVADGLWEHVPRPQVVLGQHVWSGRAGTVEVSTGPAMAMADAWRVTVHGRGGHGSQPHTSTDPVVLAAHMVVRLQSVVSREVAPQAAAVVTVGSFHAGLKENIIPSEAVFTVNVRSLDEDVRAGVLAAVRRVLDAEALASGAPPPKVEELYTFPLTTNDPGATATVTAALTGALGADRVRACPPRMGSEDFGFLPESVGVPGVYWFFGGMPDAVVDGPEPVPVNHSPHFAPALEPTLTTGVTAAHAAVMAWLGVEAAA